MSRPRSDSSSLRRSREISRPNQNETVAHIQVEEMCRMMDQLPALQEPFDFNDNAVKIAKKNALAASRSSTPKRPRSDSLDLSQTESAKRLRSSLRSSRSLPAPDFNDPMMLAEKIEVERPANTSASRQSTMQKPKNTEPGDNDLKGLLAHARMLKHAGDDDRKQSADAIKKNPDSESMIYDRFMENYLKASLFYLKCSLHHEKHRPDKWVQLAQELYKSTATLASFATSGVTSTSPLYRRALASLCHKIASVSYSRRYQLDRTRCSTLNAQIEDNIKDEKNIEALKLLSEYRLATDEADRDAQSCIISWRQSERIAPDGLIEYDFESNLKIDLFDFIVYAKKEQASARYLGE